MGVDYNAYFETVIEGLEPEPNLQFYKAGTFPVINPVRWLTAHFAVGGFSPLRRLSGMLTAHMSQIAPFSGFRWHPHRGLEIYTYVIEGQLYHEDTTGGRGVITAGEVQRMFSGDYIEHQELNRTGDFTRVIQIWFLTRPQYRGLPPHYEQVKLSQMPARQVGDAQVRDIIGPGGATDSHVEARLAAAAIPAGGRSRVELPRSGEDLFLYITGGRGKLETGSGVEAVGPYDVLLASPQAKAPVLAAAEEPLSYLLFYLDSFLAPPARR